MSNNSTKWLCIGGALSGTWREQQMEAFDVDSFELNTDSYIPKKLKNPLTGEEQYFFVSTKLNETAYDRAITIALSAN